MNITFKYKTVKIRKIRQCFYCYRTFEPGEKMKYWAGVYEMDFYTGYGCLTCCKIINAWEKKYGHDEDGYQEGDVKEALKPGQTPEQLLDNLANEKEL